MQPIRIPKFPVLRGEEAVTALQDFAKELEEQKPEELTDKQAKALVKFAQGLISSIEAETHSATSSKNIRERSFETFRKTKGVVLLRFRLFK